MSEGGSEQGGPEGRLEPEALSGTDGGDNVRVCLENRGQLSLAR